MFKQLKVYYVFVTLPFALLLVGSAFFFDAIKGTIIRNPHPQINYAIFVIILAGGVFIVINAHRLIREAKTLVEFSGAIRAKIDLTALQEMANRYTADISCLLQMVAASTGRSISHQEQGAIEHELINARERLNRRNSLPQYLTGLLVGMGLLGTFIGLLATLNDISILISSFADLDMGNVDPIQVFRIMIERMKAPMTSMGIAFSASMFGLLGSIILGLMMVGIRRLQGDIFSLLSSEIARHIEIALSHGAVTVNSGNGGAYTGDEYKVLIRIEERLAEAARLQQRTLSAEITDFQKQRTDMLRALTEQTEASNNFRNELQKVGRQLGTLVNIMEKGNSEISTQLSELTIHLVADAKENQKLVQVVEKGTGEISTQLSELTVHLLADTKENQKLVQVVEKGTGEISTQLSELTVLLVADAKENQKLVQVVETGNGEISTQLSELTVHLVADTKENQKLVHVVEKGNGEISTQLSVLTGHLAGVAKESQKLLSMQVEEQKKLNDSLASYKIEERLTEAARLQQRALSSEIDDFQKQRADMLRTLTEQTEASTNFRSELQQLGSQLGIIFNNMDKGNEEIRTQISELMVHMTADAKETHKLLAMQVNEQTRLRDSLDLRIKSDTQSV
jgi:hypothetical protein